MRFLRAALSRRAALARLVGGVAAAPVLGPALAEAEKTWAMRGAVGGLGSNTQSAAVTPVNDPAWLLKKPLRDLLQRSEGDAQAKLTHRLGAFDSDIACLNSVAYGQRVRMQLSRDHQARSLLDDLRRQLGWLT